MICRAQGGPTRRTTLLAPCLALTLLALACGGDGTSPDPSTGSSLEAGRGEPGEGAAATGPTPPEAVHDWPSFRGLRASGIAASTGLPLHFNGETGHNVAWKTAIPGLGHSSPTVWGERVFVTSAVSDQDPYLRVGLYGESPDNPEDYTHHFRLYCLDRTTGEVVWERIAYSGVPQVRRHIKSSHANCTVATDGRRVVAFFGSEGLYCFDVEGALLWKVDLGYLDAGAFDSPGIQWGFGSSPIIHEDRVIVLCDVNNQSFIAAFDVATGEELWRTLRDEVATWGTPTIDDSGERVQAIVNGYHHIGAYDVATGEALWWLRGGGDVPVPTPVIAYGLVFITNSHGRLRPVYAIRLDARGDISLDNGAETNESVVWSKPRRGAYMPTPIVYQGHLFVLNNNGVLTCYEATTGAQRFRERVAGRRGAYTASPVIADGKLYITSEYGEVHVLGAGPSYEHLATNTVGGVCVATPAISDDMLLVRTSTHLIALRDSGGDDHGDAPPATQSPASEDHSRPVPVTSPPRGELTDPVEILKLADAAAAAVDAVSYEVVAEGTGAAALRVGSLTASVVAAGEVDGLPERFRMDGEILGPGATLAQHVTAGSDGNRYWLVDHATETAHHDLEARVMGSFARLLLGSMMLELHVTAPFDAEINGIRHELRDSTTVEGEPCYVVHLAYAPDGAYEATWFISKRDFLPRARHDTFVMGDGQRGGINKTLANLTVEPKLDAALFTLEVPSGYTLTEEFAP